ncbi:unnamed protein product [Durusdinium trenchii]|uniref:Uncharacterized protein n=2 Tax=Durusdinium trenchii TaxID=1381693 RepID=A0ABP0I8P8_9DINO
MPSVGGKISASTLFPVAMPDAGKQRPAMNRLKKLQALRKQSLQRLGQTQARRLFVERSGGSAAKAAGRRRLAPVPSNEDWARLKNEEGLLNDSLLDFHLDRMVVLSSCADRVHSFSSLFYTRLSEGGWPQVKTWTKSLRQKELAGIFAKEVLFVPAHDSTTEHWWLALVICPWAACPAPGGCPALRQPFVAFLDSIDPRLSSCEVDSENLQVLLQAAAAADLRHQTALKLLREYLKKEWLDCFGEGAEEYCEESIQGISIEVPQQTNSTDCGIYVLEYARRLLDDPRLLEHLCTYQAAPAQLTLVPSGSAASLRKRWRKLGERLMADAIPRRRSIPTPARSAAASATRTRLQESFKESLALLDSHLPRLASQGACADRVLCFDSRFYGHLVKGELEKAHAISAECRKERAEGIFGRNLILVPCHDTESCHIWLALIVQPWAAVALNLGDDQPFIALLDLAPCQASSKEHHAGSWKLLKDYLMREWDECFGLTADYRAERVRELLLRTPEGRAAPRAVYGLLELANRLLDNSAALKYLCEHQEAPPELLAPLELQKWLKDKPDQLKVGR